MLGDAAVPGRDHRQRAGHRLGDRHREALDLAARVGAASAGRRSPPAPSARRRPRGSGSRAASPGSPSRCSATSAATRGISSPSPTRSRRACGKRPAIRAKASTVRSRRLHLDEAADADDPAGLAVGGGGSSCPSMPLASTVILASGQPSAATLPAMKRDSAMMPRALAEHPSVAAAERRGCARASVASWPRKQTKSGTSEPWRRPRRPAPRHSRTRPAPPSTPWLRRKPASRSRSSRPSSGPKPDAPAQRRGQGQPQPPGPVGPGPRRADVGEHRMAEALGAPPVLADQHGRPGHQRPGMVGDEGLRDLVEARRDDGERAGGQSGAGAREGAWTGLGHPWPPAIARKVWLPAISSS